MIERSLILTVLVGSLIGCQSGEPPSTPIAAVSSASVPTVNSAKPASPVKASATAPSPQTAASPQTCNISAYVIDRDPQGLNVRSAASSSSQVIGKIPKSLSTIVDIASSQGNWLEITKADSAGKIVFQGRGWVYANLLGTSTRGYGPAKGVQVYANPGDQSQILGKIPDNTAVKLLSCQGMWTKVEHQQLKGWLKREDQCPNDLTTCP